MKNWVFVVIAVVLGLAATAGGLLYGRASVQATAAEQTVPLGTVQLGTAAAAPMTAAAQPAPKPLTPEEQAALAARIEAENAQLQTFHQEALAQAAARQKEEEARTAALKEEEEAQVAIREQEARDRAAFKAIDDAHTGLLAGTAWRLGERVIRLNKGGTAVEPGGDAQGGWRVDRGTVIINLGSRDQGLLAPINAMARESEDGQTVDLFTEAEEPIERAEEEAAAAEAAAAAAAAAEAEAAQKRLQEQLEAAKVVAAEKERQLAEQTAKDAADAARTAFFADTTWRFGELTVLLGKGGMATEHTGTAGTGGTWRIKDAKLDVSLGLASEGIKSICAVVKDRPDGKGYALFTEDNQPIPAAE